METDLGERKFAFAVISDTHVNPDDDRCNSPFPVNARANRLFRYLVADLNQRDIDFVVHLGDLVHPVPGTGALYAQAAASYKRIAAALTMPIHHVPGNHDIGDTLLQGAPSEPVDARSIAVWDQHFDPNTAPFRMVGCAMSCSMPSSSFPACRTRRPSAVGSKRNWHRRRNASF